MDPFTGIESVLSLLAALLLQLPSVVAIEVDHTRARETVLLGEHVAEVDFRVGLSSVSDRVTSVVQTVDGAGPHVVRGRHSPGLGPILDRIGTAA